MHFAPDLPRVSCKEVRLHSDHGIRRIPPQVLLASLGREFCPHRWVENARVANRTLLVPGNVTEYVDAITRQPKVYTVLNSDTVKEGCKSALMPAKLMFFESEADSLSSSSSGSRQISQWCHFCVVTSMHSCGECVKDLSRNRSLMRQA